jgi:DNA-binding NarL/FixJ family response regulator
MTTTAEGVQRDCIRIGLVDANKLSREAMCFALANQEDFLVLFAVGHVEELRSKDEPPDVLLICANYPAEVFGEGLALEYWRVRFPQTRFVLLTPCQTRATILALVQEGIDGYAIRNSVGIAELVDVIRMARSGQQALCRQARAILDTPRSESDLTRRELQTVRLLYELGPNNRKQVAHRMEMSERTLNVHVRNICQKLDVSGTIGIIEKCREIGVIEPFTNLH